MVACQIAALAWTMAFLAAARASASRPLTEG